MNLWLWFKQLAERMVDRLLGRGRITVKGLGRGWVDDNHYRQGKRK